MLILLRPHAGGGIGNYLFHLNHSIMYAQLQEAALVVPKPLAFGTMNRRVVVFDFSPGGGAYDPERTLVLSHFIHGNEATRMLSFAYRYFCMQEHVKPLFDPEARHEPLGDDTLAIHIRSGDIFQPDGSNSKYGQPPLSWYELLIERCGYRDVVVVTQTKFHHGGPNPVVAEIQRRWPQVRILSDSIECDFHTLRHARHLALSGGTFGVAAAMLNTKLARLHVPLFERGRDPNFTHAFPAGSDLGFSRIGYQIRNYEGMRSWRHLPEQVKLMLEHAIEDIDVAQE